jgi:hypothetical protein
MKKQVSPPPIDKNLRPLARSEGLIVEELEGECLVYDTATDKAHCLNPSAATIWKHCDGMQTVGELETLVADPAHSKAAPSLVSYCLGQLERAHLLVKSERAMDFEMRTSRRELLSKMGIGLAAAAVVVPLVISITAPSASAALSCASSTCSNSAQCHALGCGSCSSGTCRPA